MGNDNYSDERLLPDFLDELDSDYDRSITSQNESFHLGGLGALTIGEYFANFCDQSAEEKLIDSDPSRLLRKSLSNLPNSERDAILFYHYDDLTLKETGKILGVTESRVSQLVQVAIRRLRYDLKHYDL